MYKQINCTLIDAGSYDVNEIENALDWWEVVWPPCSTRTRTAADIFMIIAPAAVAGQGPDDISAVWGARRECVGAAGSYPRPYLIISMQPRKQEQILSYL